MTTRLLTSTGYGRRVGLRVDPSAEPVVLDLLPFWWCHDQVEPERTWTVTSPDRAERTVRDLELWVAEHAVDRIFVHAAVVVLSGQALLLPGRSMTGKTTMTAALLRAGANYGSDEYAVLDAEGRVHPYPRPLSVRGDAGRTHIPAAALGAALAVGPVRVGTIAVLRYAPGVSWRPVVLSSSDAVLRLLDNTVSARSRPAAALDALSAAVDGARVVEATRDEAESTAARLLATLA